MTTYKPGDIANGYILTTDGTWVPLPANPARRSTPVSHTRIGIAAAILAAVFGGVMFARNVSAVVSEEPKAQAPVQAPIPTREAPVVECEIVPQDELDALEEGLESKYGDYTFVNGRAVEAHGGGGVWIIAVEMRDGEGETVGYPVFAVTGSYKDSDMVAPADGFAENFTIWMDSAQPGSDAAEVIEQAKRDDGVREARSCAKAA